MLCQIGFDADLFPASSVAFKCIANALLLEAKARQVFVDLGYGERAALRLKVREHASRGVVKAILSSA